MTETGAERADTVMLSCAAFGELLADAKAFKERAEKAEAEVRELKAIKRQLQVAHNVLFTEYGQRCGIAKLKCEVCLEVEGWMERQVRDE